jgi:hypothetical protein
MEIGKDWSRREIGGGCVVSVVVAAAVAVEVVGRLGAELDPEGDLVE